MGGATAAGWSDVVMIMTVITVGPICNSEEPSGDQSRTRQNLYRLHTQICNMFQTVM